MPAYTVLQALPELGECCAAAVSAAGNGGQVPCLQPETDGPTLDFDLGVVRSLRAIQLSIPALGGTDLGHYKIWSGSSATSLVLCTNGSWVASAETSYAAHACHDDGSQFVRLSLPGSHRRLRLDAVVLYVAPYKLPPPPFPPPPSPPPPVHEIAVGDGHGLDLAGVVNYVHSPSAAGMITRFVIAGGNQVIHATLDFDSTVAASEIWLVAPSADSTFLPTAGFSAASALVSVSGNITVHLQGITLTGTSNGPAITVHNGGTLWLHNCTLSHVAGARALEVIGANAFVEASRFVDNQGGACSVSGGASLDIRTSAFTRNSAMEGGALAVLGTGPSVSIVSCTFEQNSATVAGGALLVTGGSVSLSDGTFFTSNSAPQVTDTHGFPHVRAKARAHGKAL